MPTFQFEAMSSTGEEIKDVIEAPSQEEAQATIRQMGYFVTKISVKKSRKAAEKKKVGGRKRPMALGGVSSKTLCTFTRNLSILQDAGLPILRSLRILEGQEKPGPLKNALMDVCEEIESGATLSEGMQRAKTGGSISNGFALGEVNWILACLMGIVPYLLLMAILSGGGKSPFNRLYVNMIKAGEAGGALETILQRLADFQERSQDLRRKVKGALVYPVAVVTFAVGILVFIMLKIVPAFTKIFADFGADLPVITQILIEMSHATANYWYLLPTIPLSIMLLMKLIRKFEPGRYGWDLFTLKMPIFGQLVEKNIVARTTRTLGTLVSSGVPILEALHITKETSGNAVFEILYGKVHEAIREGESIAQPMREYSRVSFHPVALFFWFFWIGGIGVIFYLMKMNSRVLDDMVVNMVDVGEESGELDRMLYKVADYYDAEVKVLTESLTKLMEPLLIIVLGGIVGFIVVALFMPLIALIQKLS